MQHSSGSGSGDGDYPSPLRQPKEMYVRSRKLWSVEVVGFLDMDGFLHRSARPSRCMR